jgi:hypothetical protein
MSLMVPWRICFAAITDSSAMIKCETTPTTTSPMMKMAETMPIIRQLNLFEKDFLLIKCSLG